MGKLLTILTLSLFLFSCGDNDENDSRENITDNYAIIGKWKADQSHVDITGMEFTKYGNYYYGIKGGTGTRTGTYRYKKNKLYIYLIDIDGSQISDTTDCRVEGDKLLLDKTYYYTRQYDN